MSWPPHGVVGVVCALVAATLFALGTVAQQDVALAEVERHGGLRIRGLLTSPAWLLGQGATIVAAGLQVVALALAPVAVVQPLLVSGLVIALGMQVVRTGRPPTRRALSGAVLTAGGLAVFLVAARPAPGGGHTLAGPGRTAGVTALCLVGALVTVASGRGRRAAVVGGAAAGVAMGGAAAFAAVALARLADRGLTATVLSLAPWAALLLAGAAELASQRAFSLGSLAWSLPAMTVLDPLAAVPAAHVLLDERLQSGLVHLWLPAAAVAAVGVVLLSTGAEAAPRATTAARRQRGRSGVGPEPAE